MTDRHTDEPGREPDRHGQADPLGPHAGQPGQPGQGNAGAWQPVPGGGDYDPDQTMHVSFAARLPPEPRPGEDPLGAHGPVGDAYPEHVQLPDYSGLQAPYYGAPGGTPVYGQRGADSAHEDAGRRDAEEPGGRHPQGGYGDAGQAAPADAATTWTIPVIRDEAEGDSGEYSVGAFAQPWADAPSPAAPSRPAIRAGLFGQGAAAAQAARAQAEARAAEDTRTGDGSDEGAATHPGDGGPARPDPPGRPGGDADWTQAAAYPALGGYPGHTGGEGEPWQSYAGAGHAAPTTAGGPDAGFPAGEPYEGAAGGPWLPSAPPAADGAWSGVVDDPEGPAPDAAGHDGAPAAAAPAGRIGPAPGDGADPHEDAPAAGAPEGESPQDGTPAEGTPAGGAPAEEPAAEDAPGDAAREGSPGSPGEDAEGFPADPDSAPDGPAPHDADPAPPPAAETRSEHPLASYMLRVNGTDRPVTDAWLGESLLYVLRERLGLAGAKDGCEQGECGACSVQVDGRLVASCLVPAATAAGSEVRTVEGLAVDGHPSDVQRALAECGAVQCGFCVPGMAMTVHDLLEGNHRPTDLDIRQALSGNLCRCSGYRGVIEAVRSVAAARASYDGAGEPAEDTPHVPHQAAPGGADA